jgi:arabinose-5-phosphate isomerase
VLRREAAAVLAVADRLDGSISAVLDCIAEARGRLIVTGVGKMGCVARKAAATFCSTGAPAIYLHAAEASHGDLGIVTKDDVVLALSNSGQTAEVLQLIPYLHRFGVPIIAITGHRQSELAKRSQHVIDIRVESEADPTGLAPSCSTTVALAVCDALAIALAERRGFSAEHLAMYHPGGNLGRRLLLTTSMLMHRGEEVPFVRPDAYLREAIVTISQKRMGAVVSVDGRCGLLGILTDGDIRRILQKHRSPLDLVVQECMTSYPKSISDDSLAVDALRTMQEHSITVLPVVDAQRIVQGIIHLHDLIRAGLT